MIVPIQMIVAVTMLRFIFPVNVGMGVGMLMFVAVRHFSMPMCMGVDVGMLVGVL